jgi:hypothetical protein
MGIHENVDFNKNPDTKMAGTDLKIEAAKKAHARIPGK